MANRLLHVLVAACLMAMGSAQALTMSAEVRDLKFTVIDLNPNNDVQPSFRVSTWATVDGYVEDNFLYEGGGLSDEVFVTDWPADSENLQLTLGAASAQASLTATGAKATGEANGPFTRAYASAGSYSERDVSLWVGPDTAVTITGEIHLSITPFDPTKCGALPWDPNVCERASARASVYGFNKVSANLTEAGSLTMPFSFYFESPGYEEAYGFGLGTGIDGVSMTTPVPEPASWAMALASLCLLAVRGGALHRRHARQNASPT